MEKKYHVPAVQQAIRIFRLLGKHRNKLSLTEISEILSINKTSCMRILKTLEEEKFIFYDPLLRKYGLGSFLVTLGNKASEQLDYIEIARSYLKKLVKQTQLTVVLTEKIKDRVMSTLKENGTGYFRLDMDLGTRYRLLDVTAGKCFMAYLSQEERDYHLTKGLRKKTPETVTDKKIYIEQLEEIKKLGYAISIEEYVRGVNAFAAPIFNSEGEVILVISCLGLTSLMDNKEIERVAQCVKQIAIEFTTSLSGLNSNTKEGVNSSDN